MNNNENPLLEAALRYADLGYSVFPCTPRKPTKPRTKNGVKDATTDREQIEAWWKKWPKAAIGLHCAGLVVVDIDGDGNKWPSDPVHAADLAAAPTATTPSGGRHHVFRRPAGCRWKNWVGKLASKVDIKTEGGYIVAPPSARLDGEYQWIDGMELDRPASEQPYPPAWLATALDALVGPDDATPLEARVAVPSDSLLVGRAERYIDAMEPSIQGRNGSAKAYAAATALVHGFCLDEPTALDIMHRRFNPRCEPTWSDKELAHKIREAATKPHGKPFGWLKDDGPSIVPISGVDLSVISSQGLGKARQKRSKSGAPDPGPIPAHLLEVPGLIGQVAAHNLETCHRAQPVLALAAAIALQAVLCARKVMDSRGSRSNVYLVGLAPSGTGKEHARQLNKRILGDSGLINLEGPEDLASDAGLVTHIAKEPAALLQMDEFGRILRTIGDRNAPSHLANIVTILLKLWSSTTCRFKGKSYADEEQGKIANQPCAVLYGTTVEDSFLQSLTAESLSDGLLARMLIFEGDRTPARRRNVEARPVPTDILEVAKWWGKFKGGPGNLTPENPDPLLVETVDEAEIAFDRLGELADREAGAGESKRMRGAALWRRAEEKARKLALVYACSANHENPIIDGPAAEWGCQIAEHNTRRMLYLAESWISDGWFDARQKAVLRGIKDRGGSVTRNELTRMTQSMTIRDRQQIIDNLLESEQIELETVTTNGRSAVRYKLVGEPSVTFVKLSS